jgi:septal ring factor EnvC (AmiA/AmiB activator)
MAWVFVCIAAGAAGFLVFIVIDYLKVSAGLKPKADLAKAEIRECEAKIEAEQSATKDTKEQVASLQKEIEELEKELVESQKKVDEYREREKRRKPTKFKLEE